MKQPQPRQKTLKLLAAAFAVGGLVWIIGGITSYRFILYPLIGLMNWAVAYYCWQESQLG